MTLKPIFIIPARGGSKRVPRKNVRLFCGKPMIAWAIQKALSISTSSRVFVSTDDPYIADVSTEYGASVPFLRDKSLADDITPTIPVIKDFVNRLIASNEAFSHVCCLYPTTPLLSAQSLQLAFKSHVSLLHDFNGFTFSACQYPHPIQRAFFINSTGLSEMYYPDNYNMRTQDLRESFYDAGQFYWASTNAWLYADKMIHFSNPFVLPASSIQDIDTQDDWALAESKFKSLPL